MVFYFPVIKTQLLAGSSLGISRQYKALSFHIFLKEADHIYIDILSDFPLNTLLVLHSQSPICKVVLFSFLKISHPVGGDVGQANSTASEGEGEAAGPDIGACRWPSLDNEQ